MALVKTKKYLHVKTMYEMKYNIYVQISYVRKGKYSIPKFFTYLYKRNWSKVMHRSLYSMRRDEKLFAIF